ncbi:hypothetical protein B6S44_17590 [Bosea sp. Tri-44]|uniref:hypothetical protein n=1 Tax=Bosea sp. Tri-44 TaxID=1972137 RepID=UPI00100FB31B|nr:hypothetical protein [Bosea sp. Tri-44]RXT52582.1 hypothetical protein B6S44_17590 [Bosea sp. Tri-44]
MRTLTLQQAGGASDPVHALLNAGSIVGAIVLARVIDRTGSFRILWAALLKLAIIALALCGCSGADQPTGVARNLTVGTAQCSKFSWGISQMAECLDQAAARQSATAGGTKGSDRG